MHLKWNAFAFVDHVFIGTVLPVLVLVGIYSAWRYRAPMEFALAICILAYIPFVNYWNLKL